MISLNPKNQHAYWRRGCAYERLGKHELALADISRSLEIHPNRDWLISKRAWIYLKAKKYDLALADANRLVEQFPESDGEKVRASIWNAMKKYDKALMDNNSLISKLRTPNPDAYSNRAEICENMGLYKEAICDLEKVLEIDPNNSDASETISRLRSLLKDDHRGALPPTTTTAC